MLNASEMGNVENEAKEDSSVTNMFRKLLKWQLKNLFKTNSIVKNTKLL